MKSKDKKTRVTLWKLIRILTNLKMGQQITIKKVKDIGEK